MKDVQCYELFGRIALINQHFHFISALSITVESREWMSKKLVDGYLHPI